MCFSVFYGGQGGTPRGGLGPRAGRFRGPHPAGAGPGGLLQRFVVLGPVRPFSLGTPLGPSWDPPWDPPGTPLGPSWDPPGTPLRPPWDPPGTALGPP